MQCTEEGKGNEKERTQKWREIKFASRGKRKEELSDLRMRNEAET